MSVIALQEQGCDLQACLSLGLTNLGLAGPLALRGVLAWVSQS